jgi:hypothetical protein
MGQGEDGMEPAKRVRARSKSLKSFFEPLMHTDWPLSIQEKKMARKTHQRIPMESPWKGLAIFRVISCVV